ncbi:MAG TPA: hypothetical protein GX690_02260 [Tenericutes bacterium]|jgi:competence protein ComGC|nr:hypothetical protein [Mycoplasmatota bacterium]
MKKNKGYFLVEALLVISFIGTFMILTFWQVSNVYKHQKEYVVKNPVSNIFIVDSFRIYLRDYENNFESYTNLIDSGTLYKKITKSECTSGNFHDAALCQKIFDIYELEYVVITKFNITQSMANQFKGQTNNLSKLVIDHLVNASSKQDESAANSYRIIGYFKNDTIGYVRD